MSIWKSKNEHEHATSIVNKGQGKGNDTTTTKAAAKPHPMKHSQITILKLVQLITQVSSVAAFGGAILYNEMQEGAEQGALLEQEQFAAVGQWSCVAVVILVLLAAVVSRIWAVDERGGGSRSVAVGKGRSLEKSDKGRDEE